MAVNFAEQRLKNQAFVEGILNLTERLEERSLKRKERKVKEQAADRTIGLSEDLDDLAKADVKFRITKATSDLDSLKTEDFARQIAPVETEEEYSVVYPQLPRMFKEELRLTGNFKKDTPILKYAEKEARWNSEQKRKIELTQMAGAVKASRESYKAPAKPQEFSLPQHGAAIKAQMGQHPQFNKLIEGWGLFGKDPFTSENMATMAANVVNDSNQMMADSYNTAIATRSSDVMGEQEALQLAFEKQLAYLHNSNLEAKGIEYLSPEEAEKQREQIEASFYRQFMSSLEGFDKLPPTMQMLKIKNAFNDYQMRDYINRKGRTDTLMLYGEPQ